MSIKAFAYLTRKSKYVYSLFAAIENFIAKF